MADQRSRGNVALVTGGASGIGRSCARLLARQGAAVVVSDVTVDGGEETVRLIREDGGEASFVEADVSKSADVEALVSGTVGAYGRIDYAFNNAGIEGAMGANTADYLKQDWDRMSFPEEVAEAVAGPCSDAASFVTGQALAVDGGYVAR